MEGVQVEVQKIQRLWQARKTQAEYPRELLLKLQVGGGQGELNFPKSRKFHTREGYPPKTPPAPLRWATWRDQGEMFWI